MLAVLPFSVPCVLQDFAVRNVGYAVVAATLPVSLDPFARPNRSLVFGALRFVISLLAP